MNSFTDMLDLKLFEQENSQKLSDITIHTAAAILMFEVVKSDGDIDTLEVAEVVDILKKQFALDPSEIEVVLEAVHEAECSKMDLVAFTEKLRKHWGQKERAKLLKHFWVIALADNEIDRGERNFIDQVARMLDLEEEEITRARYAAEHKIELAMR